MTPKKFVRRLRERIKGPHCSEKMAADVIMKHRNLVKQIYQNNYAIDEAASKLKQVMFAK